MRMHGNNRLSGASGSGPSYLRGREGEQSCECGECLKHGKDSGQDGITRDFKIKWEDKRKDCVIKSRMS